jgi:phosphate acetyltransferase
MMVYKGHADGMVSGAAHTTQHTIFTIYNLLKQNPIHLWFLRSFYVFRRPSFCFGDCAIQSYCRTTGGNSYFHSADSSLAFGIEPK